MKKKIHSVFSGLLLYRNRKWQFKTLKKATHFFLIDLKRFEKGFLKSETETFHKGSEASQWRAVAMSK